MILTNLYVRNMLKLNGLL